QIDKPLPPPKNAPPKPKPKPMPVAVAATAPKPAPKPMAKPLTRLEKLRLAAQQRVNPEVGGGEE
ncbi:MAG: hypothetical protein ACKVK0_17845, partial [Pirellulales bacterium]